MKVRAIVLALLLCPLLVGCVQTKIIPPVPKPADAVPIYVTDYGRHSSLLLRDPAGHYTEYAFGDYDWFALSRKSTVGAIRAMLSSPRSTLARRQIELPEDNADDVARRTQAEKVIRLEVSAAKAHDLGARLDGAFFARHNEATYNPMSSMWFVPANERYNAFHNCNHVTARWLRKLGCEVRGSAMYSKFFLEDAANKSR
jgi:hypothetical protein